MQGLKGDATYLVVTDAGEIEKYGINGAAPSQCLVLFRALLSTCMAFCCA